MKPVSNQELILRLKASDVSGFNALFWKYHPALFANAYKLVRNTELAEDIVQEVFITLWEKRSTLDPDRDIAGWLFVICYNKSIDQLKRQLKETLEQHLMQQSIDIAINVKLNLSEVRMSTLEKAMEELSPQKRKVFELCKLQGKTYENAAVELKISKHTVKEYLSEAMISVKKYVQQHPLDG